MRLLLGMLFVSWALRVVLAFHGGQGYWVDEARYARALGLEILLAKANLTAGIDYVVKVPQNAQHVGFLFVAAIPNAVQVAALRIAGIPNKWASYVSTMWIGAATLSLSSVASIALVYALARRMSACAREAAIAALLMTCSASMFYYGRHLLPYDSALAMLLLALWLGLTPTRSLVALVAAAIVACSGFLTYYGYCLGALLVVVVSAFWQTKSWHDGLVRGIVAGIAFAVPLAVLTALSLIRHQRPFVLEMLEFSKGSATQCEMSEGWSLPWAYLWHAEHGLLALWVAGAVVALRLVVAGDRDVRRRGVLWLGIAVAFYAGFVLLSCGLERVGAFGRLSRQMVPFLCLTTATAVMSLQQRMHLGKKWVVAAVVLLIVQAGFNFARPFLQLFPQQIYPKIEAFQSDVSYDISLKGPPVFELREFGPDLAAPAIQRDATRYVLLNGQSFGAIEGAKETPAGRVLWRYVHPLQFLPYQYEGYTPRERQILRSTDISMRLIDRGESRNDGNRTPSVDHP